MKIKSLSIDLYHADRGISKSKLDKIEKSMAYFLHEETLEKDYFNIGSALHDSILLPDEFERKYIIMPDTIKIRRGKEWDKFSEENKDKTILRADDYQSILSMRNKIINHPIAKNIFVNGEPEHSYFSTMNVDGMEIPVRCRPDYVSKNCIVDIKTTVSAKPDDFSRSLFKYRYHVQASFYMDIINKVENLNIENFIFVAIEKEPPYAVGVYLIDVESIDLGRKKYLENLKTYAEHLKNPREYFGYTDNKIQVIGCPNYAFYEDMNR